MPFPSVDAHRSESLLRRRGSVHRGLGKGESSGHAVKTSIGTRSVADLAGTFRFGIEEEYFLVDAETKAIAPTVPEALFAAAKSSTLGRGKGEFLQQQLEVATEPHVDMVKARAELRQLRHTVAAIAAQHGLAITGRGHASDRRLDRGAADQGRALRHGHARSADDRQAQHAVRSARPCRAAGSRRARRRDDAHAALSADLHRARNLLAVLAVATHRPARLPARRL